MVKKIIALLLFTFVLTSLQAKPLRVMLDWFVNPDHAPILVAKQQGYFKQAGLDIKIISPSDPSDPIKLVAAGDADIGISYQPEFMIAVSKGLPLVRIGALVNSPLRCIAVLQRSNIITMQDLQGKRIGYSTGGIDNAVLKTMLEHNQLKLSQVSLINFRYDQVQALLSHRVDAVTGQMRNFEIPEMRLAGQPARAFYPENNGVPPYDELIFIANKQELHDPRLKKFIQAVGQGARYLAKHPRQSWQIFAKNHPALNNKLNQTSWFMTIPYFDQHPGRLNRQRYHNFEKFLKKTGLVQQIPALSQYTAELNP